MVIIHILADLYPDLVFKVKSSIFVIFSLFFEKIWKLYFVKKVF